MRSRDMRTLRHRLVAEIGDEGQKRIETKMAHITGSGLAAQIEARYLAVVGFRELQITDANAIQWAREAAPDVLIEYAHYADETKEKYSLPKELLKPLVQENSQEAVTKIFEGSMQALEQIRKAITAD